LGNIIDAASKSPLRFIPFATKSMKVISWAGKKLSLIDEKDDQSRSLTDSVSSEVTLADGTSRTASTSSMAEIKEDNGNPVTTTTGGFGIIRRCANDIVNEVSRVKRQVITTFCRAQSRAAEKLEYFVVYLCIKGAQHSFRIVEIIHEAYLKSATLQVAYQCLKNAVHAYDYTMDFVLSRNID
jgi:hypothetical protein